jgi:prepilin-type N-terminal cleavage/methylation domain-containing protein
MPIRRGASLIELLVVLAIISVLIGLMIPAIHAARTRARASVCQNHIRQLSLATANFAELQKKIPDPALPGKIGGWAIEILPYMEQNALADIAIPGELLASASTVLLRQPPIMRCPEQEFRSDEAGAGMHTSHFVLMPLDRRKKFNFIDSPTDKDTPWANSPEENFDPITRRGPHYRGFHRCYGFEHGTEWVQGN